jgi:hypothetical protein
MNVTVTICGILGRDRPVGYPNFVTIVDKKFHQVLVPLFSFIIQQNIFDAYNVGPNMELAPILDKKARLNLCLENYAQESTMIDIALR